MPSGSSASLSRSGPGQGSMWSARRLNDMESAVDVTGYPRSWCPTTFASSPLDHPGAHVCRRHLCDQELARFTINHTVLAQTYSPGRRVRLGPPVTPGRVLRGQPQDQRRSSGAVERPVAQPWGWVHRRVARSRCHRRIVARVTIRCNRHVGDSNWVNAANTARSAQGRCGLFTWRRNTATSWRSTSVSVFWNVELRASRPSQAMSCRKIT
jgi:hypothetical protein